MENSKLRQAQFDKAYKFLSEEGRNLQKELSDKHGNLTAIEYFRLNAINQLQNQIFERKIAYDKVMQMDIAIVRSMEVLGVNTDTNYEERKDVPKT